jgi:hypothetical protein
MKHAAHAARCHTMVTDPIRATHENFDRAAEARGPSDQSFGWLFTGIFLLVGLWPLLHGNRIRPWSLVVSGTILLITLLRPSLLHFPNRLWTRFGVLLTRLITPFVTGLLFFLIFTPMAVVLRWMGKDLLTLARDPNTSTYWVLRNRSADESKMTDQF